MREVTFDDVVEAADQLIDEGKSFTSKDVTEIIRAKSIHAMNKDVGKMLRENWPYVSLGTNYQRTSVEIEPGITAILYHGPNDGLQDAVDSFTSKGATYSLRSILEELGLEDAPYEERSRISDWLRRHIPEGYSKVRSGNINAYAPIAKPESAGTLTVVAPDGTKTVTPLNKEEAAQCIHNAIMQFDTLMDSIVTGFNKQIEDMHVAFSKLFV